MHVDGLWETVDRLAGGRFARYRVPDAGRTDPRTAHVFRMVTALLVVVVLLGATALVWAVDLDLTGAGISLVVWWRLLVIFGITGTLFYFVWRARRGYYWAYSRLRLFSVVFPVIAMGSSAVPGLYPRWMIEEQVAISLVLLVVAALLFSAHMRRAYPRPHRDAAA